MNKLLRISSILALATLLMLTSSCKSTRSTLKRPLKEYGFNYLYSKMLENQFDFEYLNAKCSIDYYDGKKKTDLRGQLRIMKDSLTWISFSPALGIEAARILLSNDSVKFVNRLNKTYFEGEYSLIDSVINTTIDYSILQSMLIGNDLTSYDINKYKASIDGGLYRITIQERRKIKKSLKSGEMDNRVLVQNIWLDPDNFRISQIDLKEVNSGDNNKLDVFYDEYIDVNGHLFPSKLLIRISSQKSIDINVKFTKIEVNDPLSFPFNIPSKYENLF